MNRRSLALVLEREQQAPIAATAGRSRDRQHAPRRLNGPVERERPDQQHIVYITARNQTARREHTHGDGQIEARPFLADIGR